MKKVNLIFLKSGKRILSRKKYDSWREIQDLYIDYMASLEFDNIDLANEWVCTEYPSELPIIKDLIDSFSKSDDIELEF